MIGGCLIGVGPKGEEVVGGLHGENRSRGTTTAPDFEAFDGRTHRRFELEYLRRAGVRGSTVLALVISGSGIVPVLPEDRREVVEANPEVVGVENWCREMS